MSIKRVTFRDSYPRAVAEKINLTSAKATKVGNPLNIWRESKETANLHRGEVEPGGAPPKVLSVWKEGNSITLVPIKDFSADETIALPIQYTEESLRILELMKAAIAKGQTCVLFSSVSQKC